MRISICCSRRLERAERQLSRASAAAPQLAVILTGRGALRESFEARAARRNFKAIAVRMLWLEPADYPMLVGMADLGLCLHQSSSGLDLPMKLADLAWRGRARGRLRLRAGAGRGHDRRAAKA